MGSKNKKGPNRHCNAKDGASGSSNTKGHGEKLITDARFASVHSDPRFQTAPKHKSKVAIDSRFDRMFTDKSFSSSTARIDKRGKPKKEASQNPLKHYYRLNEEEDKRRSEKVKEEDLQIDEESDEEEEDKNRCKKVKKEDIQIDEESESEGERSDKKRSKKGKKEDVQIDEESESESEPSDFELKSKKALSESESESESEDDDDDGDAVESDRSSMSTTDSDEEDEIYSEEEETLVPEENVPEIDKETHRLAVVNMDWNQVKAVDLYVLLSSFLPKGGQILSVAIYPSEFGLKRMEEEAVHGPVGLFDDDEDKNASDEDDDEIDNEKLRAYELSRLRYYYAVVECESIATADYLYKACDGVEFERSSNKLDLRFIPDAMEFKHDPRDVATEAPPSYEGIDFHTQALQQSKIQLTWDEDEPHRAKTLKRKFNADQLAEMEWKELLASDEGETDEDESDNSTEDKSEKRRKKQDLYRSLIQTGDGSDEEEDDDKQEMEVTFNTDLEDISKRILEKKDKKSESTWEAYLRERREKKKSRKNRRKDSSEDESSDTDREPAEQPDDFFIEEAPVNKKAGGKSAKKGKREQEMDEEAEASRAELELLLADDKGGEANLKGYNLKRKKAKGKKGKENPDEEKIPTVDYDDPRFSSLFTSPLFALDPTDPQFKRSAAYARQIAQKQQKVDREETGRKEGKKLLAGVRSDEQEAVRDKNLKSDELPSRKEKHELSSLVKSIKMKSKQVPLPSKGSNKVSGKKGKRPF